MRLNRLDLTRYGKFTDQRIDFGERGGGPARPARRLRAERGRQVDGVRGLSRPALRHRARSSPYNFLHPYPTMRIGAALELRGRRAGVRARSSAAEQPARRPRRSPSPRRAPGRELGGIDRDCYRTMFSLDDETLEAGGESILASKGDLGQLLFSASAGLADLSRSLVALARRRMASTSIEPPGAAPCSN